MVAIVHSAGGVRQLVLPQMLRAMLPAIFSVPLGTEGEVDGSPGASSP